MLFHSHSFPVERIVHGTGKLGEFVTGETSLDALPKYWRFGLLVDTLRSVQDLS